MTVKWFMPTIIVLSRAVRWLSGDENERTGRAPRLEPRVRFGGGAERVALDRRGPQRAVGERVPDAAGTLGKARVRRHVVEHRGSREGDRLGDELVARDGLQRAARLAEADPVSARGERGEVLVARGIADAVDEHVDAVELPLHGVGELVLARHDRMLAAVGARDARLLFARDGADHRGAEAARPVADEQPDATGRGVDEDPFS